MDAIINTLSKSLQIYFHTLSTLGYKDYKAVCEIILLLYLEEMLTNDVSYYISDEDLRIISRTLSILQGSSCLVGYSCSPKNDGIKYINNNTAMRVSEKMLPRSNELTITRIKG